MLTKEKNERNRGEHFDSCIKIKYIKVKDRPIAEGRWGCHALLFLDAHSPKAKERHVILPLMIATFIMQSVAFITLASQVCTMLIFAYTKRSNIFRRKFYCLMLR